MPIMVKLILNFGFFVYSKFVKPNLEPIFEKHCQHEPITYKYLGDLPVHTKSKLKLSSKFPLSLQTSAPCAKIDSLYASFEATVC